MNIRILDFSLFLIVISMSLFIFSLFFENSHFSIFHLHDGDEWAKIKEHTSAHHRPEPRSRHFVALMLAALKVRACGDK